MTNALLNYLVLPREVTDFERDYLKRMNRIALIFFAIHIPVLVGVALLCGTGALRALELGSLVVAGPFLAQKTFKHPRSISIAIGFTAMCMGGLLVHFGQGSMQIEMHFYFFVLIALLAVFANPMVIVTAAVTVALHHLILFLVLPHSIFNYEASIWAVAVHALFVVLESVAACFVARSFFDNVIGLEKIVDRRTRELDARNRDMRLVFENVGQGFMTIDRAGILSTERSAIVETWFGVCEAGLPVWSYLARSDGKAGGSLELGWDAVLEDILPIELALDQLPKTMVSGARNLQIEYKPIFDGKILSKVLLVISDVTAQLERERGEAEQREILSVFGRIMNDRAGFIEFYGEVTGLIAEAKLGTDLDVIKRQIHTIKGNCAMFGMINLAASCHEIEGRIDEVGELSSSDRARLDTEWRAFSSKVQFLTDAGSSKLEVGDEEYVAILRAIAQGAPATDLTRMIEAWRLEPMRTRLSRIGEQARSLAERLEKGPINVQIESNGLRLPAERWASFWGAFTHVVRNAVDHGFETVEARAEAGKSEVGELRLRTFLSDDRLIVEIADDGRGIDWGRLAERARAAGLPSERREQLVEALFHDGVTTKEVATEYSGRGVGMGAVRAACDELGGAVSVTSEPGKGTTFQFSMPTSTMIDRSKRLKGLSILPVASLTRAAS